MSDDMNTIVNKPDITLQSSLQDIIDSIFQYEVDIALKKDRLAHLQKQISKIKIPIEEAVYYNKEFKNADMRRIAIEKALLNHSEYQDLIQKVNETQFDIDLLYAKLHYAKGLLNTLLSMNSKS